MSTVSEIAVEYAAKGAKAAVRADQQVRDSIQTTAKTARSERGEINRWMERHQSALQTIGAATAGLLGSILAASPTMRAELSGVRTAFSLFADTVVRDVLPSGGGLIDMAFNLVDAYQGLPEPVRNAPSALILFGSAAAIAAVAVSPVIAVGIAAVGAFMFLSEAVNPVIGLFGSVAVLAGALAVAIGAVPAAIMLVAGTFVILAGQVVRHRDVIFDALSGLVSWIRNSFVSLAGSAVDWGTTLVGGLAGGIKERLGSVRNAASDVKDAIWARIPEPLQDAIEWGQDAVSDLADGIKERLGRVRARAGSVRDTVRERLDLATQAYQWGRDIISNLADGIRDSIPDVKAAASDARSSIESDLSFDIRSNDMQAMKWGQDLMQWMGRGADTGRSELESAVQSPQLAPQAGPAAAGGGGATVIFESGAIQVDGAGSPQRTAEKTADEVSRSIRDDFGALRG